MNLLHNNVLIELPDAAGQHERKHKSGLFLNFSLTDEEKYAPVYGTVVEKASRVDDCEVGDKVFFHYLSYINAKNTKQQLEHGAYDAYKTTWEENGKKYLLMPSGELICREVDGELKAMNGFVLLRAIPKELEKVEIQDHLGQKSVVFFEKGFGNLSTPELKEKYRTDIAEVLDARAFTGLKAGDIVCPYKDWDVELEYDLLREQKTPVYYVSHEAIPAIKQSA